MFETVAEFVAYVFMNLVLVGIFYWPGWLILRIATLGHYPPPADRDHSKEFVAGVALVVFIVALTIYYSHFVS